MFVLGLHQAPLRASECGFRTQIARCALAGAGVLTVRLEAGSDSEPATRGARADKSGSTRWNSIPRSLLRESSAAQADKTGGTCPVDAEHSRLEMDARNWRRDGTASSFHPQFVNPLSVGHPVVGKLSGHVAFFSSVSLERSAEWVGIFDTWLTYDAKKLLHLDAGVHVGLRRADKDWHLFLGRTSRF